MSFSNTNASDNFPGAGLLVENGMTSTNGFPLLVITTDSFVFAIRPSI